MLDVNGNENPSRFDKIYMLAIARVWRHYGSLLLDRETCILHDLIEKRNTDHCKISIDLEPSYHEFGRYRGAESASTKNGTQDREGGGTFGGI